MTFTKVTLLRDVRFHK